MTLVSPGKTHEQADRRLGMLIVAVCSVLEIPFSADGSTLYPIPGTGRGYIPDESYYIQHHDEVADATTTSAIPPDLVIEIVVSHPAADALADCALLGVPEVWVWDVPREKLEFHLLVTRGKNKGRYVPSSRSRALPMLDASDVFSRLGDPTTDAGRFDRNCRAWAEQVLVPRRPAQEGGR
jgi:Uma2 family endonuclease